MFEVLKTDLQIAQARAELERMGLPNLPKPESLFCAFLRRLRLNRSVRVGDHVKSWDVLKTLHLIEQRVQRTEPVLDIGCYASEVIVALHKMQYINLNGVDLSSGLRHMPFSDVINYVIANFMRTRFADSSFRAITAISVIEHGFNGQALLREMSRLLRPGGYFIVSFDYWPEKINTTGIKMFGMDWTIFSRQDVAEFVRLAHDYNLVPIGDLRYEAQDALLNCAGQSYTFGWLALQKHP